MGADCTAPARRGQERIRAAALPRRGVFSGSVFSVQSFLEFQRAVARRRASDFAPLNTERLKTENSADGFAGLDTEN
jgi:hypothetical protein